MEGNVRQQTVPNYNSVETLRVVNAIGGSRIELCRGDLSKLSAEDAVDILVLSAFPDDYLPTNSSLIGALHRRGVSVEKLSANKAADLRATSSCWLSADLNSFDVGFRRLLCYEPTTPAKAADAVGDVFRALVPLVGGPDNLTCVAMPLLATGNMRRPVREMLPAILGAATSWMEAGLRLRCLKIVVRDETDDEALQIFTSLASSGVSLPRTASPVARPFDIFMCYAHADGSHAAQLLLENFRQLMPSAEVFFDTLSIAPGEFWQQKIFDCLNECRSIVALLTPAFLNSKVCLEEFNIGLVRNRASEESVLYPLYTLTAELPAHLLAIHYIDCRETDPGALRLASEVLIAALS